MPPLGPSRTTGDRQPILPASIDIVAFGLLVLGFAAMYLPTYVSLAQRVWSSDEQGHGPIILALDRKSVV